MLRKATTTIISQKRCHHQHHQHHHQHHNFISSQSNSLSLLTEIHQSNRLQTSTHTNTNTNTRNTTPSRGIVISNYNHILINNNHNVNNNVINRRLFSTKNDKDKPNITGWESSNSNNSSGSSSSSSSSSENIGTKDTSFKIGGIEMTTKRKLIGLGLMTVGTAIVSLPIVTREMGNKDFEYKEVQLEDDDMNSMYESMKDVSSDVKGELSKHLLGEELKSQIVEGGKRKAVDNTVELVSDVLNSESLQNAITNLITNIVGSAQFQSACQVLLKTLWEDLINDPETTAQVIALLNTAIKDEKISKSFKELVLGLLKDEEVYKELTGLMVQLGEEQEILDATRELLTESAHRALNDPEILDHSMEFATDVVGDNVLQRTSGEALRNTVTYAVKPSLSTFLSVFGLALLFFSASALGNARISARHGKEIDAAASIIMKNVGTHVMTIIAKVLSMPGKAISKLNSAIIATLLYPFQIIGKTAGAIGAAGSSILNSFVAMFTKASSFPAFVREALSFSFSLVTGSLSSFFHRSCLWVSSLPELMIHQTKIWITVLGESVWNKTESIGILLYSSLVSILTATGTKVSDSFGLLISTSRTKADKAGTEIIEFFSSLASHLMLYFKGSHNNGTAT